MATGLSRGVVMTDYLCLCSVQSLDEFCSISNIGHNLILFQAFGEMCVIFNIVAKRLLLISISNNSISILFVSLYKSLEPSFSTTFHHPLPFCCNDHSE